MRPFIELYINNQKVYFKEPPEIFVTYAHTELHNPTVVKNSYTKTITVEGTPENNRIFNNFYDMRRMNGDGLFNPSRKETFTLYRNGEPMESGYVKLDKVNKNKGKITYDITLYGGLGQFLYNLQYKEDGEQMKLSDLEYNTDFNFEVNKETVSQAWYRITGIGGKWSGDTYAIYDHINFAPCYNGIPENFAADKVAIDVLSFKANNPRLYEQFTISKDGYGLIDGRWLTAELDREYDEWQMKDLRSYLQRPVIRFKDIIQACCKPENNGGYKVDLDPEFFNEQNQYYENAWMTLPLLSEMEVETSLNDSSVSVGENSDGSFNIKGLENGDMFSTSLNYFITSDANVELQSNGYGYSLTTGAYTFDRDTPLISANMAIYSQLVAYDKNGKAIAGSNVISCSTLYGKFPSGFKYDLEYNAPVTLVNGYFYYEGTSDYRYRFWDSYELGSWLGGDKPTFKLELKNVTYEDGLYLKFVTKIATIDNGTVIGNAGKLFWSEGYVAYTAEPEISERWGFGDVTKTYNHNYITKKKILNSENTPCDYFLSYLKMFNLHIWKDMYENLIYVRQRKNFFSNEIKDIEDLIDRGDDITIKPLTFENKWLNFLAEYEQDEKLHKDYKDNYGLEYGIQKVDTNYSFDSSSKDVLENYVFKGCITSRNKSKYYTNIYQAFDNDDVFYPPYCLDGFQTLLFKNGDTTEGSYITPKTTAKSINLWKEQYYDFMPKPNFTDKDNKSVEGANVLLFFNGRASTDDIEGNRTYLQITDDIPQFELLNDGEPCWIWSMNWDISINYINYLPIFSRYITNENGWVTHSWDFGTPKALYIPDYNIDDTSSIYTQYWKPYIRDQYDSSTRIVECKVLLKERVIGDWLQRFYYWDGRYWILNKITDYNPSSNGTTKCEFVSVNNINNYLS